MDLKQDFLGTSDVNRIMVEVATGQDPAIPDTPVMASFRKQVAVEIADIKRRGLQLQLPGE